MFNEYHSWYIIKIYFKGERDKKVIRNPWNICVESQKHIISSVDIFMEWIYGCHVLGTYEPQF